jgi:hypothetical protein
MEAFGIQITVAKKKKSAKITLPPSQNVSIG